MLATDIDIVSKPDPPSPSRELGQTTVDRRAFYFDCHGQSLFAWLHRPTASAKHRHGVVICPPLGFEQLHAARGLRRLADRLAREGIPALRFDWHGTGDSADQDSDPDRVATWQANAVAAVEWMKQQGGCTRVSGIGLRMGAMLLARAAEIVSIENLVLWAPVSSGRGYVREMNAIDMMSGAETGQRVPGVVEAAGFCLGSETAADLGRLSLQKTKPQCVRILLAGRDDLPHDPRVIEGFQSAGIPVEVRALPGLPSMLVEPHKGQVPAVAIDEIAAWLAPKVRAADVDGSQPWRLTDWHVSAGPHDYHGEDQGAQDQVVAVQTTRVRESTWRISEEPDLFGILSEPVGFVAGELPTIVVLNAGAAYRIGPGRMNVEMTRTLSSLGFRTLRLDLSGLGDSVNASAQQENDSYPSTAFRDIQRTLNSLRDSGSRRFVLMGLCSGAYNAFQAAAQLADDGLVESILINPLTYFWRDGMSLETAPTLELIREHYYLSSAWKPEKWLKLLSGRSQIGVGGALRLAAQRLGLSGRGKDRFATERCQTRSPSHPLTEDLTGDLQSTVELGRRLRLFFSTTDPGYRILMAQAGRQARRMMRRGQLAVSFLDDADHTFSRQSARQRLIEAVSQHLVERYQTAK